MFYNIKHKHKIKHMNEINFDNRFFTKHIQNIL